MHSLGPRTRRTNARARFQGAYETRLARLRQTPRFGPVPLLRADILEDTRTHSLRWRRPFAGSVDSPRSRPVAWVQLFRGSEIGRSVGPARFAVGSRMPAGTNLDDAALQLAVNLI